MNGIDRLLKLKEENDSSGLRMLESAPRFHALAQRHIEGTAPKAISGFNLFQTPPVIASRMAEIVRPYIHKGARVLEPQVGLGRLYNAFTEEEQRRTDWVMVEEARECVRAVSKALLRADIIERDFLTTTKETLGGDFDAVIMNPPFKMGRDIKHIKHAFGMVKTGGVLVSLCYNGVKQRAAFMDSADYWEELPRHSFKAEGTAADVALIVLKK